MIKYAALVAGTLAGRVSQRRAACEDTTAEYNCFQNCDIKFQNCYSLCDSSDVYCSKSCVDAYSACEDVCPCNNGCPDGCPCPYASTYCSPCQTDECLAFVDIVNGKMDRTADPCADFNQYACGGWEAANEVPSDSGSFTQFSVVRKALSETLRNELSDESTEDYRGWESVLKAKNFYSICMDEDTIDATSTANLDREVVIAWPTQSRPGMDGDSSVMNGITTATSKYGLSAIFSADQDLDPDDSNKWIISLGHPSLAMSQSYYMTDNEDDAEKYKNAYIGYIENYSKLYRDEMSTGATDEAISAMAQKIYAFEYNIAKYMWTRTENRDPANTQRKFVLSQVVSNQIISDWSVFLNEIFAKVQVSGIDTDGTEIVNVADEKWFNNTDKAINEAGMTYDDLLDYIAWRVHMSIIPYLGQKWRDTGSNFDEVVSGATPKPRWQTCSDAANSAMEWPVGKLYIEKDFQGESKTVTEEMVGNLMEAFSTNILDDATWMSETTKDQAREKLSKMKVNIGFPDWINDEDELNARYATFNVVEDDYVGTRISGREWQQKEWWQLLSGPVDKSMWLTGPAIVNAFYSSNFNSITFPAGILQPPFFSKDMTTAMNFGGIGVVIGHEITHGFDDQGSKFDGDGNYRNWWTEDDRANFDDRVQCIKDEYSGFFFEEAQKNLNGDLTAGENTADNGGLWESMYGYQIWQKGDVADKFVPGLSDQFTEQQLYYISFAQIWCSKYKTEYAKYLVDNDPHSPGKFRTIGSVQNNAGFAQAFGCKVGTPMAPEEPCRVW